MDGQGYWRDDVFIKRLWKTVKYQGVYSRAYESINHTRKNSQGSLIDTTFGGPIRIFMA
jgi:hypothetical protein